MDFFERTKVIENEIGRLSYNGTPSKICPSLFNMSAFHAGSMKFGMNFDVWCTSGVFFTKKPSIILFPKPVQTLSSKHACTLSQSCKIHSKSMLIRTGENSVFYTTPSYYVQSEFSKYQRWAPTTDISQKEKFRHSKELENGLGVITIE